ncbi:PREDICTED: G patch domain-containing protein 1-like, partial [Thamnophis sirtalis]|uniref:G patch domain-containing protein 1-like n=1 Tax=Thamnophis sirtalis TaxID=35019 RepID=A0A6I9YIY2_9SAUR
GTSEEPLNLFSLSSENLSHLGDIRHSKGRKLGISGQAFGVGALEDEDEDIYAVESLSKYDKVLKDEEPGDGLYGWTAPQPYKSKPGRKEGKKYHGKILDGFCLASISVTPAKAYPPPDLPRDYRPIHYFRPVIKATAENSHLLQALAESTGKLLSNAAVQSRHQKTATERREVLGETALKGIQYPDVTLHDACPLPQGSQPPPPGQWIGTRIWHAKSRGAQTNKAPSAGCRQHTKPRPLPSDPQKNLFPQNRTVVPKCLQGWDTGLPGICNHIVLTYFFVGILEIMFQDHPYGVKSI